MDSQDHKTTATATGHEGHGVHLCHICGWPFPNPHPSSRHRRAHKKVCGTIEGYIIANSEEHGRHLAVSDDELASDENEHTPSPNLVKKNAEGSGRVGEKSNKSEDDVYSDAVTDFSDSGISPRLEERFESMREVDKSMEPKGVEGDQTADRTEQSKTEEITNPGPPVNGSNLSEGIIPTTVTGGEAVSGQGQLKPGQDADILLQDDKLASATLDTEEGKVLDHTLTAMERQAELCDESVTVSEVVKHDLPPQAETLQVSNTSEGVNSGAHSAESNNYNDTVKAALVDETRVKEDDSVGSREVSLTNEEIRPLSTEEIRPVETIDVDLVDETREKEDYSVGLKEVSHSTEEIRPLQTADEGNSPQPSLDATEHSDAALMVSSIDQEVKPNINLDENAGSFNASEREKCDVNGKENRNLESKESFYFDTVASFNYTDNTLAHEDDHCEEKSDSKQLETGNEKSEAASVEKQVIPDSTMVSDEATNFPSSCAVDTDARNSEVLSINESRDDYSGGISSELNHDIGVVSCKNSSPTASLDVTDKIHVSENVDIVESVDVKSAGESKYNNEVCASEKTPEQSVPKEPTDGAKASESIDTSEETAKLDHDINLASSREISESKCPDITPPGVDESHSSQDFSPLKSAGIISSAELDGNFLVSEIGLITLSSKDAVPPPSDHETSATGEDKTVIKVEDVDSKSLQAEVDDKVTKDNDAISAVNLSGSSSDRADSMDVNCGSVVSDTPENISQKPKTTTEEARPDKSDTFEPPSFMTLVQPGGEAEHVKAATEIETVHNQQPKSDALQAGWFPSLTNVVNESEGRKKNEEIIAKVTNWSPVKQHHGPLKTLLNEVKSPNTKQVESESKDNNGGVTPVGPATKDQDANKDVEEWNSPARYPIEIKKEKKKKGRSYWVPFVCCSSVHRDL